MARRGQLEAELAGHFYSKGVMTLDGVLAGKFAGAHPCSLSASLTFEQTYSVVEGDGAALAELVALLSSLAEVPVREYLAVTGSVNQLGNFSRSAGLMKKLKVFLNLAKDAG